MKWSIDVFVITQSYRILSARPLLAIAAAFWLAANSAISFSEDLQNHRPSGNTPDGLAASDWSSIRAAYESNRHKAFAAEGGFVARNHGQQWQTRFDGRGFITSPDSGGWSWGLDLVSYGRGDANQLVIAPRCIDAKGGHVEYEWDDALTEWYINDPRGLEHGYTVHKRPPGDDSILHFTLAVRGGLHPRITADGRNISFENESGAAAMNYNGLKVLDAAGVAVPTWFELVDDGVTHSPFALCHSSFIRIAIDDSNAVYPLTVDPIAQQAYLKASNTGANDQFGHSVAVSGDTVVVGAYLEDSSATGVNGNQADNSAFAAGAAYVFDRSGGVWSQQAFLKASNTGGGDNFGFSVAVSGDTVVVGAPLEDSNATDVDGHQADNSASASGAAYVFTGVGCPTLGNLNCNCALDPLDIDAFVQALLDPSGYAAMHPTCNILRGDMQPDGNVDGADIQGFINLLFP